MVYEVNQGEVPEEKWEEMKRIVRDNVCAECGDSLTIHTNAENKTIEVGCLKGHHGWVERETYTQAMRRGEEIHPAIRDNIERKMMPKEELGRAMNLLALRYPRSIVDAPTAALFIMDCMRLDIDPLISPAEAVPIPFKSRLQDGREKVTVQMVITEDGWLSMAARGCSDRWAGSPSVEVVKDKDLAESLCGDEDAWLWKATGRTKDMEPGQTSMAYGYYTHAEYDKAKVNKLPAASQPGNQARIRAIKRWVRENFPECRQNMMELTAEWFQRAEGVKTAKEFIDAEYHIIAETKPPKGEDETGGSTSVKKGVAGKVGKTGSSEPKGENKVEKKSVAPPAEPTEGEGFSFEMAWLKDSLNDLKWTDETCKSYLVSAAKVSPLGTLEDVVKRLTRHQAEEFVKHIQNLLEQKQRYLL